jgi:D-arabinose 1-dehydrogenase-like Zn-dependent alcohol dehydrogenase
MVAIERYLELLKEAATGPFNAIIDGAGGDFGPLCKLLSPGARIVCYGGTNSAAFSMNMIGVLKNVELRGSTMGSRREFAEMMQLVASHRIPVDVDTVVEGLSNIDHAFDALL